MNKLQKLRNRAAKIITNGNSNTPKQTANRPNQLRFVLPISSHMTILLGSFSIMLLFAFVAQPCMAQQRLIISF